MSLARSGAIGRRGALDAAARRRVLRELEAVTAPPAERRDDLGRAETRYSPATPLDVAATLSPIFRGRSDPTIHVDPASGDHWRATWTSEGPASLCIRPVAGGARAVAFGPGAEAAIARVPELLGAGDDWSELDLTAVPWLAETRRRHPGLRLCRTNTVFPELAHAVLEQKVTGLEAHRAWAWLHRRHAVRAPGPEELVPARLLLPLTPEQWRGIPSWDWHRAGVDHARSTTVLRAAERAAALERTLADGRGGDSITARLRTVPGIGVWTAAETTQRSHGDPDSPSFGDYHLAHQLGYAFTGKRTDDEGMLELLEPWRGHRQRIVRLVGRSGRAEPRRGPRMTVQDHRSH